jgi:hypothetical protein
MKGSVRSLQASRSAMYRNSAAACIGTLLWALLVSPETVRAFSQLPFASPSASSTFQKHRFVSTDTRISSRRGAALPAQSATASADDVCTIQILMSDTGGGHRASANALRDAFDILYPGRIECDIVDIYTDYGPFWPYNDYVAMYKLMAEFPITWEIFYRFGESDFGMCLNTVLLEASCFDSFKKCMSRPSGTTKKRADMVVSVHPLCQDIPLRILSELDSDGQSREPSARKTPFCTVVTDLGSAHPTWFNSGYVVYWNIYRVAPSVQKRDTIGLPVCSSRLFSCLFSQRQHVFCTLGRPEWGRTKAWSAVFADCTVWVAHSQRLLVDRRIHSNGYR